MQNKKDDSDFFAGFIKIISLLFLKAVKVWQRLKA